MLAAAVGLVIGSTQAILRSFFSKIVPEGHAGEMFGFYSVANKVSSTIGPVIFGAVAVTAGQRVAVLSLLPFFVVGLLLLVWVPENPARNEGDRTLQLHKLPRGSSGKGIEARVAASL